MPDVIPRFTHGVFSNQSEKIDYPTQTLYSLYYDKVTMENAREYLNKLMGSRSILHPIGARRLKFSFLAFSPGRPSTAFRNYGDLCAERQRRRGRPAGARRAGWATKNPIYDGIGAHQHTLLP